MEREYPHQIPSYGGHGAVLPRGRRSALLHIDRQGVRKGVSPEGHSRIENRPSESTDS